MYLSIIPGEEKIKRKKNYAEINSDSAQECVGKMTQILAKVIGMDLVGEFSWKSGRVLLITRSHEVGSEKREVGRTLSF